jgi:LacI family transcriptional regulator
MNQNTNKIITQEDVARRAGVSRSVVSYVINDGPRKVSKETRHRVLTAIQELGYRPNKHAQILSSTDDSAAEKYIGIILASNAMFRRPYYGSILASIHEHVHERNWHIRFIRVFHDFDDHDLFDELIHPHEITGVILIGLDQVLKTPDHSGLMQAIVERVGRVACVEWDWPGVPSIKFDRQTAAYQAAAHLLDLGRTRVVYIGPGDERIHGYQQALWEKNIASEPRLIFDADDSQSGYARSEQLIRQGVSIDAVCAGTDEVAVGVLKSLHQHRLVVPGEVAIASIDNLDIAQFTIPSLTSVDVPKNQIGLLAVDLLTSSDPWKAKSAFAVTVPTQLIVRESSVQNAPR